MHATISAGALLDWRDKKLREWLIQLLRFAITREAEDQAAVSCLADEMDALGLHWRPSGPTFFARTTHEICKALMAPDEPGSIAVLRTHARRIDDLRLRRAFAAAAINSSGTEAPKKLSKRKTRQAIDLWKDLHR